eukprot:scaffold178813_cov18-Tisochrysis_lutea.AAC.1
MNEDQQAVVRGCQEANLFSRAYRAMPFFSHRHKACLAQQVHITFNPSKRQCEAGACARMRTSEP